MCRGVHHSRGGGNDGNNSGSISSRTSWTGEAEVMDYISFVGAFIEYLHFKARANGVDDLSKINFDIVLAGYSYGALITMRLPPFNDILKRFDEAATGSIESRIRNEALNFACLYVNVEEPVLYKIATITSAK